MILQGKTKGDRTVKKILKIVFSRITVVALLILFQLVLLFLSAFQFTEYFIVYYLVSAVIAVTLTLRIVNRKDAAEYKIAWLTTVLMIPVFGGLLYIVFSGNRLTEHKKKKMIRINEIMWNTLRPYAKENVQLEKENPQAGIHSRYITEYAGCPAFRNTEVRFFSCGEEMFPVFLEELEKAEKYIFLEYFIIEEGKMWNAVLDVLTRKVKQGVDVRVIYDDMGCIMHLPGNYAAKLRERGIRCYVFNPFIPVLSARLNNRNHRKIGVIDGKTAFTGGINLADEYINEKEMFGYWKDCAVLLRGDAAWSMTVMFLTMWDYLDTSGAAAETYTHYRPETFGQCSGAASGWVQPYTDNPLDNEAVGKTIYLNLISRAKSYVYITTPYLIIDELLENALCTAAKSGIDVRIVTPGIPDKKVVYEMTRSYYANLIKSGVRIYEYTPGFIHAKMFISDDEYATVGTVNLDFRSLYLHFECGVWMYGCSAVQDIKQDYLRTLEESKEVLEPDCCRSWGRRLFRELLTLISPMM